MTLTEYLEQEIGKAEEAVEQQMRVQLLNTLYKPIRPDGIISKLKATRAYYDVKKGFKFERELPYYAKYTDKGRGPGKMPPDNPIREWCRFKGIDERAVYPIRRKIGLHGTKGKDFLHFLRDFQRKLRSIVTKTTSNWVRIYIDDTLRGNTKFKIQ